MFRTPVASSSAGINSGRLFTALLLGPRATYALEHCKRFRRPKHHYQIRALQWRNTPVVGDEKVELKSGLPLFIYTGGALSARLAPQLGGFADKQTEGGYTSDSGDAEQDKKRSMLPTDPEEEYASSRA